MNKIVHYIGLDVHKDSIGRPPTLIYISLWRGESGIELTAASPAVESIHVS
jgi:hypothetical protein